MPRSCTTVFFVGFTASIGEVHKYYYMVVSVRKKKIPPTTPRVICQLELLQQCVSKERCKLSRQSQINAQYVAWAARCYFCISYFNRVVGWVLLRFG